MKPKRNLNGGYIGLLMLLIGVAIIAILFVKSTWFANFGQGRATPGTGFNTINSAQNAKNLIEQNSQKTNEQLQ